MRKRLYIITFITIAVIILIPALSAKFWWVDDGYSLSTAQQILSLKNFHAVFAGGRFFIFYWIYQTFEYLLGGYNTAIHFLIHDFIIFATAVLISLTVRKISKSEFSAFFAGVIYLLASVNTENLFRLGPQEALLSFFLAASIYLLLSRKTTLSIVFLVLSIFTKETGFVLWIPFYLLYLTTKTFLGKKRPDLLKYSAYGLIFSIPIIANTFLRRAGYSGNYVFNLSQMMANFLGYIKIISSAFFPFFYLFIASFLFRILTSLKSKTFKRVYSSISESGVFLFLFLEFVAILSPWKYVLGRYLMPATVALCVFMGIELTALWKRAVKFKVSLNKPLMTAFVSYLVFFTVVNTYKIYVFGEKYADTTVFIQSIFKDIADTIPRNGTVLYNFQDDGSTKEYVDETAIQLDLLYNRPDIKVGYLDASRIPTQDEVIVGASIVPEAYSREGLVKRFSGLKEVDSVRPEKTYVMLTNPEKILGQLFKKSYLLILKRVDFTKDGIVANYVARDFWYKLYLSK